MTSVERVASTADRLKQIMKERSLKQIDIVRACDPVCKKYGERLEKNDISQYVSGKVLPGQNKLRILGEALNVSEPWLMGYDVSPIRTPTQDKWTKSFCESLGEQLIDVDRIDAEDAGVNLYHLNDIASGVNTITLSEACNIANEIGCSLDQMVGMPAPTITDDYVTYPVIGEIAAGYDHCALEDYDSGDYIDVPVSMLKGRSRNEFFVLRIHGDSMYPLYMDGDKVLIKKTPTLDYSGQIGAFLYGENATLKKIEYVNGEDWLRLVPINPNVPPTKIEGADLEQCRVLGMPVLLIRDVEE